MTTGRSHEERLEAYETAKSIGNYLGLYFDRGQGVRLGESCVVSLKDHEVAAVVRGHVKVLTNRMPARFSWIILIRRWWLTADSTDPASRIRVRWRKIYSAIEGYITIEIPRLTAAEDEAGAYDGLCHEAEYPPGEKRPKGSDLRRVGPLGSTAR